MTPFEKRVVLDADREVVEEVRRPQPLEVLADDLLGRLVVRHPLRSGSCRRPHLDVIEVGIGLDDGEAALLFEAGHDLVDHRSRAGGRQCAGGRDRLSADGLSGGGSRRPSAASPASGARRGLRLRGRRRGLSPHGHGGRQRSEEKQQHTHSRTFVKYQACPAKSRRLRDPGRGLLPAGANVPDEFTGF